jgi:hypothetical protein
MAPILAPTAILVALYLPQILGARNLLLIASATYILAPLAVAAVALFGNARYTLPFDAVSAAIRAQNPSPARIISNRQDDAANVAAILRWPPERGNASDIVLVWLGKNAPEEDELMRLPADAQPLGPVVHVTAPVHNYSGRMQTFSFQRYSSQLPIPDQNIDG